LNSSAIVKRTTAALLTLVVSYLPASAGIPAISGDTALICRQQTAIFERREKLPAQLLSAISLAETGRRLEGNGETLAWPWTIYAQGRGQYFTSKAQAIAAVRKLRAKGVRNIDVGCMQVNLHYHPDAFANLEEAFDPAANVAYAARFVRELQREVRSWSQAIAFYHSRNREHYLPYRRKVHRLWYEERRRTARELRERRIAEFKSKRAARLASQARQVSARTTKSN
jgi:hypothetical protein